MNEGHESLFGVNFKSLFEGHRIHVPGIVFGVDEHGFAVLVGNGIHRRVKSHVAAEHLVALQGTGADFGHAVQGFASELGAKVECRSTGRESDGVLAAHLLGGQAFNFVDVRTHGAHPVGFVCFGHILDLVAVHGGAGEPNFTIETRHRRPQPSVLPGISGA